MTDDGNTVAGWREAIDIFARYAGEKQRIYCSAEHDKVWMGPGDTDPVTDEDKARLEVLGWHYEEGEGFWRFV